VDGHRKEPFYEALLGELPASVEYVSSARAALGPPDGIDLVLVNDETWPYCAEALAASRERAVPSLHLADGILEWHNLWENPRSSSESNGSPLFQPLLCDKIACLGRSQARVLEALGNTGRCEVTGSPRFDRLLGLRRRTRPVGEAFRLLVATANQPAFTDTQRRLVDEGLHAIKRWADDNGQVEGVRVELVWRLGGGPHSVPLVEQLTTCDALITTPSTLQLEAMLVGLPVAVLDFANRPHYVPAAFTATAERHVPEVIAQLVAPSPARLLHQQAILDDALSWRTPATPRVASLVAKMAAIGREARRRGQALEMPARLVADATGIEPEAAPLVRAALHEGHPLLAVGDVEALRTEVAHLRRALRLRPTQIVYRALSEIDRLLTRTRLG
jgi:hypothetical protein